MKLAIDLDWTTIQSSPDYNLWSWYDEDPWTWLEQPPIDGALEGIQYLHDHGHDITFVTARYEHPVTEQWLHDHLGSTGWWTLIEGTSDKWNVPADAYLDDSPTVVKGLWERGLCVVKYKHSRNLDVPCSYAVDSWPEFIELVDGGMETKWKRRMRSDPYRAKRAKDGDRPRRDRESAAPGSVA